MYSIKLTAAGRRIGIAGRPEAVSATGGAGVLLHILGGDACVCTSAGKCGFGKRRRERRFK